MSKKTVVLAVGLGWAAFACSNTNRPTRDSLVAEFEKGFIRQYAEVTGRNEFGDPGLKAEVEKLKDGDSLAIVKFSTDGGTWSRELRFQILEAEAYPIEDDGIGIAGIGRILFRVTRITREPGGGASPETIYEEEHIAALAGKKGGQWSFKDEAWIRGVFEREKAAAAQGRE